MSGGIDIRLRGIDKRFPGVHALRGVDLDLRAGEVHGLVGQNGAGKSTLIKILTGAVVPDAGDIEINGHPVAFQTPADAEQAGIAVVHQDGQLFPELSVADNIVTAHPPSRGFFPFRLRDRRRSYQRARELLERLGIDLDVERPAGQFGPAERKFIEVARAIAAEARALLLDEPTAALEPREVQSLFSLVERLRGQGVAVLFVSHKLDEVLSVSTRITVLRDGLVVAQGETKDLGLDDLVRMVAGGEVTEVEATVVEPGETLLEARGVRGEGLGPIDLSLRSGEVVSLTGLLGSGASAFARSVAGAVYRVSGEMVANERRLRPGDRAGATTAGVGFVPEDRKVEGIVSELSVEQNIALASIRSVSRWGWLSRARIRRQAEHYISLLDIRPPDPNVPAANLSGGNQQKVLLARWLASRARVLVTEEPTHGLDVRSKPEIHRLLQRFVLEGGSVVLVSTELGEILGLSDRIGVFREGRLIDVLPRGASEEEVTARAVGLVAMASGDDV